MAPFWVQTKAEVSIDEKKPVVLVIDDNRDIQELVTELMGDTYNIITASNGSEGIRKGVRYVPDLIICDVMMPVELMRKIRLKHACRLIKSTDKSMSEIAYEVGFSSPAYFTRCYREAYGETPTETRNKLKG